MLFKSTLLITLCIVSWLSAIEAKECTKCEYAFRCTPYYSEKLIWALADGLCMVFPNGCVFGSKQCERQTACASPMIETTQDSCPCASNCDYSPQSTICAEIPQISPMGTKGGVKLEFDNQCFLDKWSCENGRPYASVQSGPCQ